jgi:energy-coupling factor transporter ATP-binding protein EcfA2
VRIKTLSLTDFRAFPGPTPTTFELDSKNLLVYGENGSGKSSLFYALRGLFSYNTPPNLLDLRNSFSGTGIGNVRVHVEFGDSTAVAWEVGAGKLRGANTLASNMFVGPVPVAVHPGHTAPVNAKVREAAKFSAMLDYRSLLNTNYKHGDGAINLFEPIVMELLAGFVDLATNKTILELWQAVQSSLPTINTPRLVSNALHSCTQFNTAMKRAITLLLPEAQAILRRLCPNGLQLVDLPFKGVRYNVAKALADKAYVDKEIGLQVSFRNIEVDRPQNYLNEARLSALALALYLGARLACTPQTTSHLKLLVLDDVLVGLDHSNRLPVLNVLMEHFSDWQIILLTHDRAWFDLARHHLVPTDWTCCEIYEGDPAARAPMPLVRKTENRPAKGLLAKGRALLALGYVEAAANYTRQAFEYGLRGGCEFQKVKLNYKVDSKDHQAQDLLDAIKIAPRPSSVSQADWSACLQQIELFKNVVMNPYSHPSAPNIPRQEVVDAANAVDTFLTLAGKT